MDREIDTNMQKDRQIDKQINRHSRIDRGCSLSNSMLLVRRSRFNTTFYKIFNAIGDVCERTCHKVQFYVANKFL